MNTLLVMLILAINICGVQLEGDWNSETVAIVHEAVYDIGYRINPEAPCLAFMQNFPTLTITMGPTNASGGCENVKSGACVSHRKQINIITLPRVTDNRTKQMVHTCTRNLIVHELGHVFDWNLKYNIPKKMLNNKGFYPSPATAPLTWRQHPCDSSDYSCQRETFADMFLAWIYGKWANNINGRERLRFMNLYMPGQISSDLTYR